MRLKVSSAKRRPFCLGLNVLKLIHVHKGAPRRLAAHWHLCFCLVHVLMVMMFYELLMNMGGLHSMCCAIFLGIGQARSCGACLISVWGHEGTVLIKCMWCVCLSMCGLWHFHCCVALSKHQQWPVSKNNHYHFAILCVISLLGYMHVENKNKNNNRGKFWWTWEINFYCFYNLWYFHLEKGHTEAVLDFDKHLNICDLLNLNEQSTWDNDLKVVDLNGLQYWTM